MQVFIKYGFFEALHIPLALTDLQFALLVVATVFIAAAGNIINDCFDIPIDLINKPSKVIIGKRISETTANRLYFTLTILGVGIGFYLANVVGKPTFASLFVIIAALLYFYSSTLKGVFLIGNILVSVLVALSVLIVGIFDVLPVLNPNDKVLQLKAMQVVFHYATFAFLLNLIREIVKDIQDINGDKNGGLQTIPIVIGRTRATYIIFGLAAFTICCVVLYMYTYLYSTQAMVIYFLFLVMAPLLYFCVKSFSAERPKDYAFLSLLLKGILCTGMISMLLYKHVVL
ncbi:4-hydroxybenzoate polyprenyltransferase [Ulvibacter litoralis]|uniref:4-hydroxybenzoate polyprenyltransferase n=2 Tax=Ulvibacter litoralis TaxID=227084 RepID=A0A1G7F6F6_9FLAO|nr:prenyltransferase [Ulvibacter litoralis]SDE71513.1 4-hydroxybenzoate polyprenyltransferase [Ulvibacter litoralis]